jgi:hypothetical protein
VFYETLQPHFNPNMAASAGRLHQIASREVVALDERKAQRMTQHQLVGWSWEKF